MADITLYIYNTNFKLISIVDEWISLIWKSVFNGDVGGFDLEVPATKENINLYKQDFYISRSDKLAWVPYEKAQGCPSINYCNDVMIIEATELSSDEDGNLRLYIGGSDITSILTRRVNITPTIIPVDAAYGYLGSISRIFDQNNRGLPISEFYTPRLQWYSITEYHGDRVILPYWHDWIDGSGDVAECKEFGFLTAFPDETVLNETGDTDYLVLDYKKYDDSVHDIKLRANAGDANDPISAIYLYVWQDKYHHGLPIGVNLDVKVGEFIQLSNFDYYYVAQKDTVWGGDYDSGVGDDHYREMRRYVCVRVSPVNNSRISVVPYINKPNLSNNMQDLLNNGYTTDLLCFKIESTTIITDYEFGSAVLYTDDNFSPMYISSDDYYTYTLDPLVETYHDEICDLIILGGQEISGGYMYYASMTEIPKVRTYAYQSSQKVDYDAFLTIVNSVAVENNLGLRLYPQGDIAEKPLLYYPLKWALYDGEDRTNTGDYVEFSVNMENLLSYHKKSDIKDLKNFAYITAKYPANPADENIKEIGLTTNTNSANEDLYRREIHINSSTSYRDGESGPIIRIDSFRDALLQEGNEALSDKKHSVDWDCEILADSSLYRLNEDFFLGDIVVVKDTLGSETTARVVETTESWDNEGFKIQVKLQFIEGVNYNIDNVLLTEGDNAITSEAGDYIQIEGA